MKSSESTMTCTSVYPWLPVMPFSPTAIFNRRSKIAVVSDFDGAPVTLPGDSKIAIDGNGNIVVGNKAGVHLITTTGLAAGWLPWSESKWTATQACHHHDSTPWARAAVRTVPRLTSRSNVELSGL